MIVLKLPLLWSEKYFDLSFFFFSTFLCSSRIFYSIAGGDAALYREEARDPGQVRQGGAQHYQEGERGPNTWDHGSPGDRTHAVAVGRRGNHTPLAAVLLGGPWTTYR